MKGILFALAGGFFLTFQSVANATISDQIGTWQAAAMTQLTGFVLAILIVLALKDTSIKHLKKFLLYMPRAVYSQRSSCSAI